MNADVDETEKRGLERRDKLFDVALATRNFEIELLWKRSLFFWGFIAAAFIAYAAFNKDRDDKVTAMAIANFGAICSLCWTLANRGSKYWQQAWERRLFETEFEALGSKPFGGAFIPDASRRHLWGQWSVGWHFSVSRLAIALSDFTFLIWIFLVVRLLPGAHWPQCLGIEPAVIIPIGTLIYALVILKFSASENKDRTLLK
jgi:hypothetical protein